MNGMRTFTGNSVGDTATYSCDLGYELIGSPTTTCTAAADGNSASFPPVPPPECRREYFINILAIQLSGLLSRLRHVYKIKVNYEYLISIQD